VIFGFIFLYFLSDWPRDVKLLSPEQKRALTEWYEDEITGEKRWHVDVPLFIGAVGMGSGPSRSIGESGLCLY
jgi:hypothetical protein